MSDNINLPGDSSEAGHLLDDSLAVNVERLHRIFVYCDDFVCIPCHFGDRYEGASVIAFFTSIVKEDDLHSSTNTWLSHMGSPLDDESRQHITLPEIRRYFTEHGAFPLPYHLTDRWSAAIDHIANGHALCLFDGWNQAVCMTMNPPDRRAVAEPLGESVVFGPHEGTVESLDRNIGLLRLRLRSPEFKIERFAAGGSTRTPFMIGYIEGKAKASVLDELKRRLAPVAEVELLDTTYFREIVSESSLFPFPQCRFTERPDLAVNSMLEGKIILMAEGSGTILICPTLFTELFQAPDDYYQATVMSAMVRNLRIAAFFIALSMPSVYIALSSFHPELIPTVLLLAILNTREGIPFPAVAEALLMLLFFELLREASIRLPRSIGPAVSIVGALVIGEAAISAGIASPIMVVIVALTGIASFSLPQYELAVALRTLMLPLMALTFLLGGYGLMIGFIFICLALASMRSLGQPYFAPIAPLDPVKLIDISLRSPFGLLRQIGVLRKQKAAPQHHDPDGSL